MVKLANKKTGTDLHPFLSLKSSKQVFCLVAGASLSWLPYIVREFPVFPLRIGLIKEKNISYMTAVRDQFYVGAINFKIFIP